MKSGLACALSAFTSMALKARDGQKPKRTLVFIGTVDEEDFMRGAEAAIADGWVTKDCWVLDTEPTNGRIEVAHKGRTWFEITVKGITAHASTPWKGRGCHRGHGGAHLLYTPPDRLPARSIRIWALPP